MRLGLSRVKGRAGERLGFDAAPVEGEGCLQRRLVEAHALSALVLRASFEVETRRKRLGRCSIHFVEDTCRT